MEHAPSASASASQERPSSAIIAPPARQPLPRLNQPEEIAGLIARFRAALPAEMCGRSDTYDVRDGLASEYARVLLETISH